MTKATAKIMKPEKSCTNPVAASDPQISLIMARKITRITLVMIAIGIVERNNRTRRVMVDHQAVGEQDYAPEESDLYARRAVSEISDRRPLQTSSTTT